MAAAVGRYDPTLGFAVGVALWVAPNTVGLLAAFWQEQARRFADGVKRLCGKEPNDAAEDTQSARALSESYRVMMNVLEPRAVEEAGRLAGIYIRDRRGARIPVP